MGSQVLLYGYAIICTSLLVFNILYYLSLNSRDRKLERVSKRFQSQVDAQLDRLRDGGDLSYDHLVYLRRKLSRIGNLLAFDHMMSSRRELAPNGEFQDELAPELQAYYLGIQPVILHLAMVYRNREDIQAAYFAWFLAKHRMNRHMELDAVQDILVEYMNQDSLYCRVNAFRALCSLGSSRCVAKAVAVLDQNHKFFHSKLLTDNLLAFTGSHQELTARLLEEFPAFSVETKLAVLNYVRFRSGDYCEWMLKLLTDPEEDKELRLSAIRYFGRYVYPPAKPVLLAFAADKDPLHWEYVAISATSLASYEGEDVIDALTAAIYSSNWYIRTNAAASLTARGLEYGDLIAVVGGGDRYVREMMLYQLQCRQASEEKKKGASV